MFLSFLLNFFFSLLVSFYICLLDFYSGVLCYYVLMIETWPSALLSSLVCILTTPAPSQPHWHFPSSSTLWGLFNHKTFFLPPPLSGLQFPPFYIWPHLLCPQGQGRVQTWRDFLSTLSKEVHSIPSQLQPSSSKLLTFSSWCLLMLSSIILFPVPEGNFMKQGHSLTCTLIYPIPRTMAGT